MADGVPVGVFDEACGHGRVAHGCRRERKEGATMTGKILQINFKFSGSGAEYEKAFSPAAEPIAAVPGLRWKIWLWNEAEREGGGIMLFDDAPSAQAYVEGPIAAQVGAHPAVSDLSVKQFDVLDGPTAITRGPV